MNDEAIHIPARKKQQTGAQMVVKVTPEAYNTLVEIYNESTLSLKQIASLLIVKAAERVVYDKEESEEMPWKKETTMRKQSRFLCRNTKSS